MSLEEFQKRTIFPGESVGMYCYELKWLLQQAMPELSHNASKQLLIHQFLTDLPAPVSCQLRAVGNTTNLEQLVERAKVLMVVDDGPNRVRERRCLVCDKLGHIARNCWQSGNEKGMPSRGNGYPN